MVSHCPMGHVHAFLILRSEVLVLVTNLDAWGSLDKLSAIRMVLYLRSVVAGVDVVVFSFKVHTKQIYHVTALCYVKPCGIG